MKRWHDPSKNYRRNSEQSRAQLASTVDQLREQIADTAEDIGSKVSPENIKAEVGGYISQTTHGWMDALQATGDG